MECLVEPSLPPGRLLWKTILSNGFKLPHDRITFGYHCLGFGYFVVGSGVGQRSVV